MASDHYLYTHGRQQLGNGDSYKGTTKFRFRCIRGESEFGIVRFGRHTGVDGSRPQRKRCSGRARVGRCEPGICEESLPGPEPDWALSWTVTGIGRKL